MTGDREKGSSSSVNGKAEIISGLDVFKCRGSSRNGHERRKRQIPDSRAISIGNRPSYKQNEEEEHREELWCEKMERKEKK